MLAVATTSVCTELMSRAYAHARTRVIMLLKIFWSTSLLFGDKIPGFSGKNQFISGVFPAKSLN